jgi:purine catabolism regulator
LSGERFVEGLRPLLSDPNQGDALDVLHTQLTTPGVHEPIHLRLLAGERVRDMELTVNNRLGDSPVAGVLVVARDITEREVQKQRRIMDELFADLVVGAVDPAHLSRAHAAGLLQAAEYRAIVLPLEQKSRHRDDDPLYEVGRQIERLNAPGSVWGTFGGLGGVIMPSSGDVRGVARLLHDALVDVLATDRVVVAVGAPKEGPSALKDALDDAIRVLTLARRRGLKGTVTGDDVVVPALLASAPEIAGELSQMLGPLAREDLRSRGELVHTLRTYLAEGLSVHRTAQTLVVHRNTVRSRLKRIETLVGGDISSLKLPLELALLANDLDTEGDGDPR